VGANGASQQSFAVRVGKFAQAGRFPGEGRGFTTDELKPVSAEVATRPIAPTQGSSRRQSGWRWRRWRKRSRERIRFKGPKHGADPSRFLGRGAFLTLFPQRASAAIANPSSIQAAQGAIVFRSAFLSIERAISGTA
jgi:hypothetical protein